MGNNSNSSSSSNIAEKFKATCHPGLSDSFFDTSQQMLVSPVKAQEGMEHWQQDVDPLMRSHHLFMPFKYLNFDSDMNGGCCTIDDRNQGQGKCHVFYLPFIYTLEKEIISRRQKNSFFKEQQIWKLLKYLTKGVIQWTKTYPQQKLGVLCPSNVVINPQGQVKLVTKISFFLQVFGSLSEYYIPPQNREAELIKNYQNSHNINRSPQAIEASSVYSIGAVLLEVATLTLVDYENFGHEQKEQTLRGLHYSWELKDLILNMLEPIPMKRVQLRKLLEVTKLSKSKN